MEVTMLVLCRVWLAGLLLGLCIVSLAQTEKLTIPIGAIFKPGDDQAKTAFRYAQSKYNSRSTNPFALASYIDDIDVADSFTLASRICDRMASGVFLFFGVKDMTSLDIVQSFTRTFHMPYLSPSTPTESPGASYEIHMKPESAFAIIDMIRHFGWDKIIYVYDSDEGLRHIQLVLDTLSREYDNGHPFHLNLRARRIFNVKNAHDELRQLDRMDPDPTFDKIIVFDLSSEEAYRHILRQIPEVGMNKAGYRYLVATMDFSNLDMGRYLHGGVNITGFQLLDPENKQLEEFMDVWARLDKHTYPGAGTHKLTYEAALAVDAIEVVTRALKGMITANPKIFQSTIRRKEVYNYNKTRGVPCTTQPPLHWMHGDDIMEQIKMLEFDGLTGKIRFDEAGYRTDYKLDVVTVGLDSGPTKIGSWTPEVGFRNLYFNEEEGLREAVTKGIKIVTTIIAPPFLMERGPDKDGNIPEGNEFYTGYVYDLAKALKDLVKGFEYKLVPVTPREYGRYFEENNTWTGMVGELVYRRADFCIAPLTITYDREKEIDFTKPFMNFGISIMIKKPEITKPGVFSFMEPLSPWIWISIVCAYFCVSLGLFLVSRFSPYEWESSSSAPQENKFNVYNSLWFSMGALMLQGSDACPRSFSGRVIGTVWWFFVLIIISSYTANLAAFLTIERMQTPIDSADDLAVQNEIKYGTLISGSTTTFFEKSTVPTYSRMYNFMSSNPQVFVETIEEGVDKVRKSKGKYAFLLESPTNEFFNNREPCDTMKVGRHLNSKGFGIATPKGSPYRDEINLAVLQLIEDGTLHKLKNKWWKDKGQCSGGEGDSSGKRELSLSNVAGIFYILIAGLVLAIVLASVEFLLKKSKFIEKTPYMKATETAVTLLSTTPTVEKGNGCFNEPLPHTANNYDKEEATFSYGYSPPSIGFEHFMHEQQDHTDL